MWTYTILYNLIKDNTVNGTTKLKLIEDFDQVLSLDLLKKENNINSPQLSKYIEDMIIQRNIARNKKDYKRADEIRKELEEKGILIKDTREGTKYEIL